MAPRQTREQRNRLQRERQQQLRDEHLRHRRAGRDDFARILLFRVINGLVRTGRHQKLDELGFELVSELVKQGFDELACERAFDDLVGRYGRTDNPFRRKVHLH
ncbi:hypothetical protein ACQZ6F_19180 [Rhizobium sp. A22-96]